jgi:hypothetical protein
MVIWAVSAIGLPSGLKAVCEELTLTFLRVKRFMVEVSDRYWRDWPSVSLRR